MKNKLLLTSALAGSLMFSGISLAQTTVSGNLDISFKGVSSDGTIPTTGSRLNDSYIEKNPKLTSQTKENLAMALTMLRVSL
jgi:hypothetical protein